MSPKPELFPLPFACTFHRLLLPSLCPFKKCRQFASMLISVNCSNYPHNCLFLLCSCAVFHMLYGRMVVGHMVLQKDPLSQGSSNRCVWVGMSSVGETA